jgi:hypothetical protein
MAPLRLSGRSVLRGQRCHDGAARVRAALRAPRARQEPGGEQSGDERAARRRGGRHPAGRARRAALRAAVRAARAAACPGAGHRGATQPRLRRDDPACGAHWDRHERQREHGALAGPGVPASSHGSGLGPHDRALQRGRRPYRRPVRGIRRRRRPRCGALCDRGAAARRAWVGVLPAASRCRAAGHEVGHPVAGWGRGQGSPPRHDRRRRGELSLRLPSGTDERRRWPCCPRRLPQPPS